MAFKAKLIADIATGQELDKTPFLLMQDAFPKLENVYLWRRRAKRKNGSALLGRLQRIMPTASIGLSNVSPWSILNIYSTYTPPFTPEPNASIKPGSVVITIAAGPNIVFTDQGDGTLTSPTPGNSGTINYTNGDIVLTHTAGAGVASTATFTYYPTLPCMGLPFKEEVSINAERTLAFDMIYAYEYSDVNSRFQETPSVMKARWSGTNYNFFWAQNAQGSVFVTNNNPGFQGYNITGLTIVDGTHVSVSAAGNVFEVGDHVLFLLVEGMTQINGVTGTVTTAGDPFAVQVPDTSTYLPYTTGGVVLANDRVANTTGDGIRWYDGNTWSNFTPYIKADSSVLPANTGVFLVGCLIIFYYRDYLICLSTYETDNATSPVLPYRQRARWSQNGTFYYTDNPLPANQTADVNAWRSDIIGKGGFVDAPTTEAIQSASLIRDNLIVFFERSTWKLRYTGNQLLPFVWDKISSDFGSESPFSTINFDVGPVTVGDRGIVQCDGTNTLRIDNLIPDEVFSFHNENNGPIRVHGIRDFDEQICYFTFPNNDENGTFPNRVLIYNYRDQSWAFFKDSLTCYGTWQRSTDILWADAEILWEDADRLWGAPSSQALYPVIIGGNQQGFVMQIQTQTANDQSLAISDVIAGTPAQLTSPDHNLSNGDFVVPIGIVGKGSNLNGITYQVTVVDSDNFQLYKFDTASQSFTIPETVTAGTYLGHGEIKIKDNFSLVTKQFNPFLEQGISARLGWIDFYTDVTDSGKFTVNVFVDSNTGDPINLPDSENLESNAVPTYLTEYDYPGQDRIWNTLYDVNTPGSFFQLELTLSDAQMNDDDVCNSEFTCYAINLWVEPGKERLS